MYRSLTVAILGLAFAGFSADLLAAESLPVRKATKSGVCHDASSPNYNQIKNYTTFNSLTECVASGGHLAKSAAQPCRPVNRGSAKALYDTDDISIIKKSRDGLCLDATDATFSSIVRFSAYAKLEDCLGDGGRLPTSRSP